MITTTTRRVRAAAGGAILTAAALLSGGCGEDLHTGPEKFHATLEPRNWADTLVVGDGRPVAVRVIDDKGREVLDASVHWAVATPTILGAAALRAPVSAGAASESVAAGGVDAQGGDSVHVDARQPGATDVVITLTDPRFYPTAMTRRATVVVAGVRAASARDTTITALGDTAVVLGTGLVRSTSTSGALVPRAGLGVQWTRVGAGAVQFAGPVGDSVRAVGQQGGTDTLVATHPFCLAGARCADTVLVHVAQRGSLGVNAPDFRAWSFGDSVVPTVVLQDARGHAVAGATLQAAPLTAADSAIVSVGAPAAQLVQGAAPSAAPALRAVRAGARVAALRAGLAPTPLRMVVRSTAASTPAASFTQAAPVAVAPLVAQGNGTARVALRAVAADGTVLAVDTIAVVVRQIAAVVHVTPPQSLLTPGDSIPVRMEARDARGYVIADAAFVPAAAGVTVSAAGIVHVAPGAAAGTASVLAAVTGPANPAGYTAAPIQAPAQDTAWVRVRTPPAIVAGDTTGTALDAPVFSPDGHPVAGAWVRFVVPAGRVTPDSAQTGSDGVAHAVWNLPTRAGSYTASAVLLGIAQGAAGAGPTAGGASASDSAGRIVLRRTLGVQPGAAAALALAAAPPASAAAGAILGAAPAVQVTDSSGNPVHVAGLPVVASLGAGAVGTLAGTLTVPTDSAGVAHFADLVLSGAAGARTLRFSAPSLAPVTSGAIVVTVGSVSAGQIVVTLSAPTVASGATATVTVTPRDEGGNPIGAGRTVVISVGGGAGNAAASTATVSAVRDAGDGTYVATLTGVRAGSAVPISATVDGVAATSTPALQVTGGTAARLTLSPATLHFASLGATATLTVTSATDAAGNAVPTIGLVWSSASGVAAVVGGGDATGTVTAVGGGTTTITATLGTVTATSAVTVQQVTAQLVRVAGDGGTAVLGTALPTAPSVRAVDAGGANVAGVPVTFSIGTGAGPGATIGGGTTQTVTTGANGVATAGSWTLGTVPGAYALAASAPNVATVAFSATATAGAVNASQSTLTLSAAAVASGATVTATVTPKDAYGNRVGAGHAVAVMFGSGSPGAGVATGTVSAATDRGDGTYAATITGVRAGTATAVTATADGTAIPATAPTLTVTAGAPAALAVTAGNAQSATVLTAVAIAPAVTVTDAAGNAVPGVSVTFAAGTGQGTLTGATATTNASGVATLGRWTLGQTAGAQAITATVTGVAQAATIGATAVAGAPYQIVMGRDSLSLAALSAGDTVTAVVKDAGGNVLSAATVTWTLSTTGPVSLGTSGTRPDGTKWVGITSTGNGATQIRAAVGGLQGVTAAAVRQIATQIAATGPSVAMDIGDTTSLAVTATDANGVTVPRRLLTFTSTNGGVVLVDTLGALRGIAPGTAALTVSSGVAGGASATTSATTVTTTIAYHDFCTLAGLNTSGSTTRSGCAMRLTGTSASQTGGVWQPVAQKLSASFETTFKFQISSPGGYSPGGADGLALVIQSTSNTATGQYGGGIGYPGLTNALAIELDTWQNTENNDPDANHVAVQSCGTAAITAVHNTATSGSGCTWGSPVTPSINFKDGQVHTVRVTYVPGALSVYFDGATTPAITSAITLTNVKGNSILDAQGRAWIGFTGATGGAWENHDILTWNFTPSP